MSRIDAAWKRASGELVGEVSSPSSVLPGAGADDNMPLAAYTGEEKRRTSRLATVRPASSGRAVPSMPVGTPAAPAPSLRGKLVSTPEIEAVSVEQYKRLAVTLDDLQIERGIKSLTISSALPREGKTLTVANLALTFGSYGRRVLVIDADLHRPSIHELFGIQNQRGLAEALRASDMSLPAVPVSDGVSVVVAGHAGEASGALLSSDRLRLLIADAAAQYDWILLDTPPVALLTDAQFVVRASDGILFVIAAGTTPYTFVQRCVAEFGANRIIGTVLNRVDPRVLPVRNYYHQYGYYA